MALTVPVLLGAAASSQADAVIASWNLKHAGWNNGKHLEQVAAVASHMDLIGLQEVMKEAGASASSTYMRVMNRDRAFCVMGPDRAE